MTTETLLLEPETVELPVEPQTLPLPAALDAIRADSRQEPEQFLNETVVPHGGE